jgi:hypothetical protein
MEITYLNGKIKIVDGSNINEFYARDVIRIDKRFSQNYFQLVLNRAGAKPNIIIEYGSVTSPANTSISDLYDKFMIIYNQSNAEAIVPLRYHVFISQASTAAPTVIDTLEDNIPSPVWTRSAAGTFLLTKVGAFKQGKTTPFKAVGYDESGNKMVAQWINEDVIQLTTYAVDDLGTPADDILSTTEFNVEVYG